MKKKLMGFAVVAMSVATYHVASVSSDSPVMASMTLDEAEAVAGCEVSSNASLNKGYCVPKFNSSGDACVTNSDSGAVRCSGDI